MEPNANTPESSKSLLDEITADPEIINRARSDGEGPAQAAAITAPVVAADGAPKVVMSQSNRMGAGNLAPVLNLLSPAVPLDPDSADPGAAAARLEHKSKLGPIIIGLAVLTLLASSGGYFVWVQNAGSKPVVLATPSPSPTPTPIATPTPSPTPLPSPTPVPVAAPSTVTAPVVAPTAERPQAVKVTSKSGLWLRSSPDSSNQKNVIGWMPNGATVSVDTVGDFWWHGTYAGKAGYFAVNYTN